MLLEGMMIAAIPVGVLLALILWIKFEIQKHGITVHDRYDICSLLHWRDRNMVLDEQRLVVDRVREQRARKTHPADRLLKTYQAGRLLSYPTAATNPGFSRIPGFTLFTGYSQFAVYNLINIFQTFQQKNQDPKLILLIFKYRNQGETLI